LTVHKSWTRSTSCPLLWAFTCRYRVPLPLLPSPRTWVFVSSTLEQAGKKTDFYGPNPQGQLMFDPNGHFSEIITRSDLPKFASNNRQSGTPEENKAAMQGSIAFFGTYSVSETDKVLTFHIEGSTFPNWKGADQKRLIKLSGDELTWTVPTPSIGSGTVYSVWKRAK
jgi:hypothetical protein